MLNPSYIILCCNAVFYVIYINIYFETKVLLTIMTLSLMRQDRLLIRELMMHNEIISVFGINDIKDEQVEKRAVSPVAMQR